MQMIHCDGCKRTESSNIMEADRDIRPVSLSLSYGLRSWERPDEGSMFNGDICSTCLEGLLSKYFKVPSQIDLNIPAFMSRTPVA